MSNPRLIVPAAQGSCHRLPAPIFCEISEAWRFRGWGTRTPSKSLIGAGISTAWRCRMAGGWHISLAQASLGPVGFTDVSPNRGLSSPTMMSSATMTTLATIIMLMMMIIIIMLVAITMIMPLARGLMASITAVSFLVASAARDQSNQSGRARTTMCVWSLSKGLSLYG